MRPWLDSVDARLEDSKRHAPGLASLIATSTPHEGLRLVEGMAGAVLQKKRVKGDVIGITVTPITAPQPIATEPSSPMTHATSTDPTAAATPPRAT